MRKYLATGLVAIIPALLVLWVATIFVDFVTAVVGTYSIWNVLIGLGVALAGIFAVGFALIHSRLLRKVKEWVEDQIVQRTPLVKTVYGFAKQVSSIALEEKKYDQVVLCWPFGKNNTGMIGFLTDESTSTVFVPSSPNPLTGQAYIGIKYEKLNNWTYDDVLKYGMSVGLVQKSVVPKKAKGE